MLKVHLVLILSLININMFDARLLCAFRAVSSVPGGERKIRRLQHNIRIISTIIFNYYFDSMQTLLTSYNDKSANLFIRTNSKLCWSLKGASPSSPLTTRTSSPPSSLSSVTRGAARKKSAVRTRLVVEIAFLLLIALNVITDFGRK